MEMLSDTPHMEATKAPRNYIPRHVFDRRTRAAKRFARLVDEFTSELGGKALVSEARMAIVRQLAGVTIQLEDIQAQVVRDEPVDAEQHVRLANLQSRLMNRLGLGETDAKPKPKTLADHLAEREGRAA
jgi:hypothetical protein